MSEVVEEAFRAVQKMPADRRDPLARAILSLTGDALDVEPDHLPYVLEGLAQIERGAFVEGEPHQLVAEAFRRHRS